MKKCISVYRYLFICIITALFSGCNMNNDDACIDPDYFPVKLNKLNWEATNYKVLSNLINDYGINGKFYNPAKAPYVVLDWDQTCAHLDVEEAVMRYQISNLRFKITKEQFPALLKDDINGTTRLSADYNNIILKDINEDIINNYNFLFDNFSGLGGNLPLSEIQQTLQYNDFIARISFLYEGYCNTTGIGSEYGYPWILYLFTGFTIPEVKGLATEVINYELGNKISKQKWESPAGLLTKSGNVSYSYKTGLRIFPEMQNLIASFTANGIEVFIVSASYKPVVEVFSGFGNYGYNVPSGNVIAMEVLVSDDGKILPEYKPNWIQTQRQGKVDAINRVIKGERGKNRDPLFSAGDSDGDYEMCTKFPDMKLSLIWNRLKGGDIGKLCTLAVLEKENSSPRYILQGRNENTGVVIPYSESILLGETVMRLLP